MKIRLLHYKAPPPARLQELKNELGYSGRNMANLCDVAPTHWRRYTNTHEPVPMSYAKLFTAVAKLELDPAQVERIHTIMRGLGATIVQELEKEKPGD